MTTRIAQLPRWTASLLVLLAGVALTTTSVSAKPHTADKAHVTLDFGDAWKVLNRDGSVMARKGKVGVMVGTTPAKTLKEGAEKVSANLAQLAGPDAKLSKPTKAKFAGATALKLMISGTLPKDGGKLGGTIYMFETGHGTISMFMMMGPLGPYKLLKGELAKIVKSAKLVKKAPAKKAPAKK